MKAAETWEAAEGDARDSEGDITTAITASTRCCSRAFRGYQEGSGKIGGR